MKKIKTVLTAFVMLVSVSSFATAPSPDKVTTIVKAAFEKNFSKATLVTWEKKDDFYFATFQLNTVSVEAAYSLTGELVGTSRSISLEQIPLSVSMAITQNYQGYQVDNSVSELTYEGRTWYSVTVTNDTKTLKLKCFNNGDIEIESKSKKG